MFLALRELRRGWRRFLLVGTVVALVAVLSTVLGGLADGLVRDGTSGLRSLEVTHLAFEPHAKSVFSRSTLDGRTLAAWRATPGVEATPLGVSFANAAPVRRGGPSLDVALFGIDPGGFLARPWLSPLARGGAGIVLDETARADGARAGDRYRVAGSGVTLPVLGFGPSGSYGHAPIAYVSLRTWQAVTYGGDPRGRFSAVALRAGAADPPAAAARTGTEVKTKSQAYDGSPGFTAETATMTLIRGFLVVISALIVGAFFTVLTVQRTREIGLLKALGASSFYVLRDGLAEMTAVVAGATVAGAGAGVAMVAALSGGPVPVELQAGSVVAGAVLLVLAGVAGSLVAYRRIARVEPAVALGMEA